MDDIGTYPPPVDRFSSPITVIGNLISSFRERATQNVEKKEFCADLCSDLWEDTNTNVFIVTLLRLQSLPVIMD